MSNRLTNIIAGALLFGMFVLAITSVAGDSVTMDEVAHLPSGYSYLTQKDMRLNPEHPPLIKDLAALPLLFIKGINFPSEIPAWQEDVNGQWTFGYHFLYQSNNPVDKMIFWARVPMVLLLILLGFYIFKWAKELYGQKVALLALFLFSFSPTFIAHGRLVTTDIAAAIGIFTATYYFIKALKKPTNKNIIWAGIAFGIAQLLKFSAILLIPFFVMISFIFWLIKISNWKGVLKSLVLTMVIGYLLVWPVYQYHVWNYPLEKQIGDIKELQKDRPIPFLPKILSKLSQIKFLKKHINYLLTDWKYSPYLTELDTVLVEWSKNPILRPYAQYLLGLFLVLQRGSGGHTTYFLGEISATGWKNYFPIVYSIKEPLAFHLLTLIAIFYAAYSIKKPFYHDFWKRIKAWLKKNFSQLAMFIFITFYWTTTLISNLNIGVRHLLPVFPFTILLVSGKIGDFLKGPRFKLKYIIVGLLLFWQAISVISIYPHFLAYFNEIVGALDSGYIFTVNSNLDWGQDLKRLKKWVEEQKIGKIYVDYFGGGDASFYLKEKYAPWWGTRDENEFPKGNYLAVSATFLQGGRGKPAPGFDKPTGYYNWLDKYQLIEKIGYSIFVYYID